MTYKSVHHIDLLQHLKNKLFINKLPYAMSGLTADVIRNESHPLEHLFFNFISPANHIVDVFIGEVKGPESSANLMMTTTIHAYLLSLINPIFRGHQFDKIHLWEKNLLSPLQIVEIIQENLNGILVEFGFSVSLFYGRFNLEYNLLTYTNCGFNHFLHYKSFQSEYTVLNKQLPLGLKQNVEVDSHQQSINNGDVLFFHWKEFKEEFLPLYSSLNPLLKQNPTLTASNIARHLEQATINDVKVGSTISNVLIIKTDSTSILASKCKKADFMSDLAQLKAARSFVRQLCHHAPGDSEKLSLQLELVINEIFCNITKHAYHNAVGKVVIEGQCSSEGVYLTISDQGDSFNPTEIKHPNLYGEQESGFGFFIIQQIVDHISYVPKIMDDEWNYLRIFKRYFPEEKHLGFSYYVQDAILVISPKEKNLDIKNASQFKEEVLNLIRKFGPMHVIVELENLHFIDSSGLGAFLSLRRILHSQGNELKLSHLNKSVSTMFEIISMDRIFDIFKTTEEAIRSFKGG